MEEKIRKSVLGRGLSSLIPVDEYNREFVRKIALTDIISNRFQPRNRFEESKLHDLEESIREHGIIQPVIVRKSAHGYELIAGERRFIAAQRAGLEEIPAIVKNVDDQKSLELALIENIQRDDLNPIEEARGYLTLCEEFKLSHEDVSKKVGRSRTTITNSMRLLKLPEKIQDSLKDSSLSVGHAKVLLGVHSQEMQLRVFEKIIKKSLNVRETEKLVRSLEQEKMVQREPVEPQMKYKCRECADFLRGRLGSAVDIKMTGNQGKIIIHFNSEGDLDRIVGSITPQPHPVA
ncbi:MAG: ParB/RepB/Spo0J family partition protein [Candidatus Auribacterota bacterium]